MKLPELGVTLDCTARLISRSWFADQQGNQTTLTVAMGETVQQAMDRQHVRMCQEPIESGEPVRGCQLYPRLPCNAPQACTPTSCDRVVRVACNVVPPKPGPWTTWTHRNGSTYVCVAVANTSDRQDEYPATVWYVGAGNGRLWSRRASDWFRSMTLVGPTTEQDRTAILLALALGHQE